MSGSSEAELKHLIRSLGIQHTFLGTFDCRFPGFLDSNKIKTAIVNTGPRESGGVHWIAFAWNPIGYKLYLFDALGWKDKELEKYYNFSYKHIIKRSALETPSRCVQLVKNSEAVQCTCAGSCGLFCVLFLYCFNKFPNNPYDNYIMNDFYGCKAALKPVCPKQLHLNQIKLYDFLRKHSDYFVKNETHIVNNTNTYLIKTH
ncbi:protease [Barthadenovirus sternae]|nr:protease [Tern adenovirus]UJZ92513.1 protease [Tern atadenovirus 1]